MERNEKHPNFEGYDARGLIVISGHVIVNGMFRPPAAPITRKKPSAQVIKLERKIA